MKRFLIIVLLLINIYPSINKTGVALKPVVAVYAQTTPCTNPSGSGSSGNGDGHGWLWYVFHWVANAASFFVDGIGEIFNFIGSGGNGETYGSSVPSYLNSDPYMVYISTGYNNGGWGNGGPMDPCQFYQMMGLPCPAENPIDPNQGNFDCAGVLGGTAHLDSCGRCVGGTTGLQECEKDCAGVWGGSAVGDGCHACAGGNTGIIKCDTMKITPVICDSVANARGQRLTNVMNSASSSPLVQQVKDTGYSGHNEASVNIVNDVTYHIDVVNFQTGAPGAVAIPTALPGHNAIAGLHAHTEGHAISPSPADIYHLANGNLLHNNNYFADYVTSFDSSQWALAVTDTASAHVLINNFPTNVALSGAEWDSSHIVPAMGGSINKRYFDLFLYFYKTKNYPMEYCYAYANICLLKEVFGITGIKYYVKKNGQYKELNSEILYDNSGNVNDIRITICN